jgi:hypothetical protein
LREKQKWGKITISKSSGVVVVVVQEIRERVEVLRRRKREKIETK